MEGERGRDRSGVEGVGGGGGETGGTGVEGESRAILMQVWVRGRVDEEDGARVWISAVNPLIFSNPSHFTGEREGMEGERGRGRKESERDPLTLHWPERHF